MIESDNSWEIFLALFRFGGRGAFFFFTEMRCRQVFERDAPMAAVLGDEVRNGRTAAQVAIHFSPKS